jgi:hypothetical protein
LIAGSFLRLECFVARTDSDGSLVLPTLLQAAVFVNCLPKGSRPGKRRGATVLHSRSVSDWRVQRLCLCPEPPQETGSEAQARGRWELEWVWDKGAAGTRGR